MVQELGDTCPWKEWDATDGCRDERYLFGGLVESRAFTSTPIRFSVIVFNLN